MPEYEYVICYVKDFEKKREFVIEYTEQEKLRFTEDDQKGKFYLKTLERPERLGSRPNLQYPILVPDGTNVEFKDVNKKYTWVVSKETFQEMLSNNEIVFQKVKSGSWRVYRKVYMEQRTPRSLFDDIALNREATEEARDNFDNPEIFSNPKPVNLIKHLLKIGSESQDLVLDFFAGSGTIAHAVMDLNIEDGGNRKWISVQLPETTDESSEAFKAGYKNIAQISRERIRRAGEKIGKGDIGFKAFALEKSNYRQWNVLTETDNEELLSKQVKLFAEKPLVDSFDEKSVVYEILEKEGFGLNAKVSQEKGPLKPWVVTKGDKKLVITFASKIDQKDLEELNLLESQVFVCFDSALSDTKKVNVLKSVIVKVF